MTPIQQMLFDLQDKEYAEFQSKLAPTVSREKFIGVRMPKIRALVKKLKNDEKVEAFLRELPHEYHDENLLHALLISEFTDFDRCIDQVNRFLPYVDNWAVCDGIAPKGFKKDKEQLFKWIKVWVDSDHEFTCRFGMRILMEHYLEEDFRPEVLEIPAAVPSEAYYVQMMIAWFYSTALIKQWDATIPYLTEHRLDAKMHNKTIQKTRESRRITPEQKEYLKSLKR